jgi:integrase
MGFVYRKQFTKPIPTVAEIVKRAGRPHARWKDRRGRTRLAPLTEDGTRVVCEARTWTARYRDADGNLVEEPTGCRDEQNARAKLADLERRAERVKAGIVTPRELAAAGLGGTLVADHIDAYERHLLGAGVSCVYRKNALAAVRRVTNDCQFVRVADVQRGPLEDWLAARLADRMSARSRNAYRAAIVAFCNWCVGADPPRMTANPLTGLPKANEKADPRRRRRAMTEEELTRLLAVARARPLRDVRTVRRGKRKGEEYADLRPETVARLEQAGRERALIYKTLVLTGLRRGELASLTVAQVDLAATPARLHLNAADEKNREGSTVPVRADLAAELKGWIAASGRRPKDRLFTVPRGLLRILDRDLRAAGIPKRDARGRTLDVHALRHTFGTLLSANGVAPRTAQEAMRHSRIDLTMNVYTDPKLLNVAEAVEALPALPLDPQLAPLLAPAPGSQGQIGAGSGNDGRNRHPSEERKGIDASSTPVNKKGPLSTADSGPPKVGPAGFEPTTSCTPSKRASQAALRPE